MFSAEPAATALDDDSAGYPVQCSLGCALAVWSMPESEAARWRCPAPARDKRQCDAQPREQQ